MSDDERTEYILQMARRLGLTLPQEELIRVSAVLGGLERAAAQVRDASLASDTIAAAVFCPEQVLKK